MGTTNAAESISINEKINAGIRRLVTEELFQESIDVIVSGTLENSPAKVVEANLYESRAFRRIRAILTTVRLKEDQEIVLDRLCRIWRKNAAKKIRGEFLELIIDELDKVIE